MNADEEVKMDAKQEAGNSLLNSYESVIRFKVNKKEVGNEKEKCAESSEFKLNEVTWKVKVCKKPIKENDKDDPKDFASVELHAVFKDETSTWSCNADVGVNLIAVKSGAQNKDGKIENFTYSKKNSVGKNEKFLEWSDFNDNFVDKDMATFAFNIQTKKLDRSPQLEQTTAKFLLRVKQVNDKLYEYSNELVVRGIRWKILAAKIADFFAIFVVANENDIDTKEKWTVTANVKLISSKDGKTMDRKFTDKEFDWTQTNMGFTKYLEWSEFTKQDNGYVRNNAALVEIELEVKPKTS